MATSKSSLIPIDSSGPSSGQRDAAAIGELAQAGEGAPGLTGLGREAADRHQPAKLEVRQCRELGHRRVDRAGLEARLGRIEVDVDLDQDRVASPGSRPGDESVQPCGELDRVHRLDGVEDLEGGVRLVRLQRPDEVPAGARHLRHLRHGLLDAVLPEEVEPGSHVAQRMRPLGRGAGTEADDHVAGRDMAAQQRSELADIVDRHGRLVPRVADALGHVVLVDALYRLLAGQ